MQVLRSPSPDAGHAARGQQRVADDHAAAQFFVGVAAQAAIVVGQAVQVEVGDQPVQPAGDPGRPTQRLLGDRLGDLVAARFGHVEHLADLRDLGVDLCLAGLADPLVQVVHLQDLDVHPKLAVVHREVGVHIQHAGVGVAQKADARFAQRSLHAGRGHPVGDLGPGPVVVAIGARADRAAAGP